VLLSWLRCREPGWLRRPTPTVMAAMNCLWRAAVRGFTWSQDLKKMVVQLSVESVFLGME